MKLNGFQCDDCANICNRESLSQGWIAVEHVVERSGFRRFHFCSIGCLRAWAIKQWREEPDNHSHLAATEFNVTEEDCKFWRDN